MCKWKYYGLLVEICKSTIMVGNINTSVSMTNRIDQKNQLGNRKLEHSK